MSMKGASGLIRLAQNPKCEIQAAMVLQPGTETQFYEKVVGLPYDREFGERQSSKRRGSKFEQNAYAGDARLLREALASFVGVPADDMRVRNLLDDHPGSKEDARIGRLSTTRTILRNSLVPSDYPHIVIQPQLLVPTEQGMRPYFFVSPDLLVWSAELGAYVVGDLKSFVVRENEVAKGDLARVRLQLGANALGLAHEYDRLGARHLATTRGLLFFSMPNGLRPHAPRVEDLAGAIEAIRAGIGAFVDARAKVIALAAGADAYSVVGDLQPNFEENCLAHCVLAAWCREQVAGSAVDLGDAAKAVLGEADLQRLADLMAGDATPATDEERVLAQRLQEIAALHGMTRAA